VSHFSGAFDIIDAPEVTSAKSFLQQPPSQEKVI
jgi:hypothetical protein